MIQLGGLFMAVALLGIGIQGLLGKPDSNGKKTSIGVAIACIVLGLLAAAGALAAPYLLKLP